jgi:hypothetical protein
MNEIIQNFNYIVVAANPDFSQSTTAVTQSHGTNLNVGTGEVVADGTDHYSVKITLKDQFGNYYRSVDGIRNVETKNNFTNTVDLNQFGKNEASYMPNGGNGNQDAGDGILYTSSSGEIITSGATALAQYSGTDVVLRDAYDSGSGGGVIDLWVRSFSPTRNADPYTTYLNDIGLNSAKMYATSLCSSSSGCDVVSYPTTDLTSSITGVKTFYFKPALALDTITPHTTNNYSAGEAQKFDLELKNNSAVSTMSGVTLRSVFSTYDPCFLFNYRKFISPTTTPEIDNPNDTTLADDYEILGNGNPDRSRITPLDYTSEYKIISSIPTESSETYTISSAPVNLCGGSASAIFSLTTQLGYRISPLTTLDTYHYGNFFGRGIDVMFETGGTIGYDSDASTYTNNLSAAEYEMVVKGQVRSNVLSSSISGFNSIGDIKIDPFRTAVRNNVSSLTRGAGTVENFNSIAKEIRADWSMQGGTALRKDNNDTYGRVYYFRNTEDGSSFDITLGSSGNATVPGTVSRTIIIEGGNLYIKKNVAYGTGASLGVIVLKDNNGNGGNVYIDQTVTNIVGAFYVEGSVMSAKDNNSDGAIAENEIYDGFNTDLDATTDLRKYQLYWQGSLVSRNTIGGYNTNVNIQYNDGTATTTKSVRMLPLEWDSSTVYTDSALSSFDKVLKWPNEISTSASTKDYVTKSFTNDTSGTKATTWQQKTAWRYDLNYLRRYNGSGSDITSASGIASNSPFILEYSSLVQTKTPLGFENIPVGETKEVVR